MRRAWAMLAVLASALLVDAAYSASVYVTPASPPSLVPIARIHADLISVGSGNHRALTVQLGTPPQTLRLIVDTGSSDLLALNSSFCAKLTGSSRTCYNPLLSTAQSSIDSVNAFEIDYLQDSELLSDHGAHYATAIANIPVSLIGSSNILLLGAADTTLQYSLTGFPAPSAAPIDFVLSSPDLVYLIAVPYTPFLYSVAAWNSLTDVDGIFGLAADALAATVRNDPGSRSPFNAMTQTINQPFGSFFALDYRNARMLLGGIDDSWRSSLSWSYQAAVGLRNLHSFLLWDLSVCGVNLQSSLLQSPSQPLNAIVDTGSTCLSLPAELFDALVTWLPVACTHSDDGLQPDSDTESYDGSGLYGGANNDPQARSDPANSASYTTDPSVRYCWLPSDLSTVSLPTLTFRLSAANPAYDDNDSRQPRKIVLPLNDLLSAPITSGPVTSRQPQRLCVTRTGSIYAVNSDTFLSFGSRTLSSIVSVYSADTHQIALMNYATVNPSNNTCIAPIRCVGQQQHDDAYNLCVEPSCSDYYFFTLNHDTHQCELSGGFHAIAAIVIALVLVTELALNEGVIQTAKKIQGIQRTNRRRR